MGRKHWTDEKLITRVIHNITNHAYWENIHELRMRPSDLLFNRCLQLISSQNEKEKRVGIDILAQLGSPNRPYLSQTLEIYFNLLNSETDELILSQILFGIGHNNENLTAKQIEKICAIYQIGSSLVYEGLIFALGFIDTSKTIDILIQLSTDQKAHNRDWATFFLAESKRNNKKIRQALWNRIDDKNKNVRLESIMGLAKRKDSRVLEVIKTQIHDIDYPIGIFQAILDLKDPQFLPLLEKNLEQVALGEVHYMAWLEDLKWCITELSRLQ